MYQVRSEGRKTPMSRFAVTTVVAGDGNIARESKHLHRITAVGRVHGVPSPLRRPVDTNIHLPITVIVRRSDLIVEAPN